LLRIIAYQISKSKRPSGASSSSKRPHEPKPVFFLDRNFGSHIVADILRQDESIKVEIHDDHFKQDETDENILKEVGYKGWIFISKDKYIRYRTPAQLAVKNSHAKVVIVRTSGDITGKEIAEIIKKAIPRLLRYIERTLPPFIIGIGRDSRINELVKDFTWLDKNSL
jgi:predicted nuclease of predicted toxin-antitoxin system